MLTPDADDAPLRSMEPGRFDAKIEAIGRDGAPLAVIDGFVADPDMLKAAAEAARFAPPTDLPYPGLRAPAPTAYGAFLERALGGLLTRQLGVPIRVSARTFDFSIVTTPPASLAPGQRRPHYDSSFPGWIAVVHYLCDERFGGTSFYRHRATGYEMVTPERLAAFEAAKAKDPIGAGYMDGDDAFYERIAQVGAAYNRAAVYYGMSLHSGDIPATYAFDPDPRTGRLTIASFVRIGSL